MGTKADNAIESLMNGLVQYVDDKINAIPYVKTDIGVVKAVNLVNGKYIHTVTVRNFDYTGIKSLGNNEFTADSTVYILVPNGQYNNMFILGYMDDVNASIKGGTINIGNGKFVVDRNGNMTAIGGGKIGLFALEDGGFKYYSPESPTDVLGYIEPSATGSFGGIKIGGQSLSLEASREIGIGDRYCSYTNVGGAEVDICAIGEESDTTRVYLRTKYATSGSDYNPCGSVEIEGSSINMYNWGTFSLKSPSYPSGYIEDLAIPKQINMVSYTWSRLPMYAPSFVQGSDKNIKKEIKELDKDKASKFILSLKPCEYKLKDESIDKTKHHGFIAQEVKESMYDDWSVYVEGETKGMTYTELIADMVSTIQYQQKQIENMKKEITKMKKDITKLGKEE